VDERYTSVDARQQLFDEGGYKALKKSNVDSFAAKLMLEQWFNS
jgi:putative Holliday junction resolvase